MSATRAVMVVNLSEPFRQGTEFSRDGEAELAKTVDLLNSQMQAEGANVKLVAQYFDSGAKMLLGYEMVRCS